MVRGLFWIPFVGALAGCPSEPQCVEIDALACTPAYEPTFDRIFEETLAGSCGVDGSSCHAPEGHKAGLVLAEPDAAYEALLDGRVEPGDPGCSLLVRRLESGDRGFRMPPGSRSLAAGERCAIERWIADGAER